jgi:hypothetical protein
MLMAQHALKYEANVTTPGKLELSVPFPSGTLLTVFIIGESHLDHSDDLLTASQSSLDFWDNPYDDEDWNHVSAR